MLISESLVIGYNGLLTTTNAFRHAQQLAQEGPPSAPDVATPELLRPPRKPATPAQAPPAAAPVAAKPTTTAAPTQTRTTTRNKTTGVTESHSESGTTTTSRPKKAPAQAGADVTPKVSDGGTNGVGPKPNGGTAKPHGGKVHNDAIDRDVAKLRQDPTVSNIRKNQQQVDAKGNKVGTNRPDIQYDKDGCHHCTEFDTNPSNGTRHGDVIQSNDPKTTVHLRTP